jgi:adenylosuccinate lyase
LEEPFSSKQVGSSAMPFKRNPVHAEKISSLARLLSQMPSIAWHNMAHSLLERTLDDSANRRTLLPEAFLICDEILTAADKILAGLSINSHAINSNLKTYAPFANTEKLLMVLARAGGDRQEMHERIREHAMSAWASIQNGGPNNLTERVVKDQAILTYLTTQEIKDIMTTDGYLGFAPKRSLLMAYTIEQSLLSNDY